MKPAYRIAILFVLFAISASYIAFFFNGYQGLADGNDYAGLARAIARGQGFSLGHVYPLALTFDSSVPQPNNMWPPAYPVYLAIWFIIFGANDFSVLLAAIALVWGLILVTYFLCGRILGYDWGVLAAAIVGSSQSVLKVALEGSPEILTAILLTSSLILLTGKRNRYSIVLSAILFGLAALSRYQILAILIPVWIFYFGKNLGRLGLYCLVLAITISPWLIRNAIVLGNPIFSLQAYGEFTKGMGHLGYYYYTYRSLSPMTLWYSISNFPHFVFKKFIAGSVFFMLNIPAVLNFFGILPVVYACRKLMEISREEMSFIKFVIVSAIIIIGLSSLDGHHWRHLVNLQALFAVMIAVGLKSAMGHYRFFRRRFPVVVALALVLFPARFPFQEMELSNISKTVRMNRAAYGVVASKTAPGEIVISDVSDGVWWYADRPSVWIPVMYADIVRVAEITKARHAYLENTSGFFSGLSDEELFDFHYRYARTDGIPGGWALFTAIAEDDTTGAEQVRNST